MEDILKVKDLSVALKTQDGISRILDKITFNLKKGETLGVVGESGCGKSMLASAIMGLISDPLKVDDGSVLFEGEELIGLPEKRLREYRGKKIAMIFQDPMTSLNPIMKCGKQLVETILAHEKVSQKDAIARSLDLISQVGIDNPKEIYNKIPAQLSGGQRQRIVIAMALCCSPDLIICDEPTTALDVVIQKQILILIKKLVRESGASCIFISHDMGVVANMADNVMVMYAGQVVEYADIKSVFRSPAHPYSKALQASLPQNVEEKERLNEMKGSVPMLDNLPTGCLFEPRCPMADWRCSTNRPELKNVHGHYRRCFKKPEELTV
jgi:oligopeptide/dipeptide ABC transporter ATP-binding protein